MPPPARRHRPVASRLARLLAPLLPLFAGWLATPPRARADDLTLALNQPHPFAGLGVEIWPGSDHVAERDALMAALHVRFVRVPLAWRLPDRDLTGDTSVRALLARIQADGDPRATAAFRRFGAEMTAQGIAIHGIYWGMPDAWSKRLGTRNGHPVQNAEISHLQDYANWIAAQLLAARDVGIRPAAIEITNEPDGTWNDYLFPADYDALLVRVRRTMNENGLQGVAIEGPGTSKVYQAAPYIEALLASGHIRLLGAVSVHDYDTIRLPEPAGLAGLPPALLARIAPLPLYVTEFSTIAPRWNRPPYDAGPGRRGGRNAATGSDAFGVAVAAEALRLVSDGASAIFHWQLEDQRWEQASNGLLDLEGRRRPAAAALIAAFGHLPARAEAIPVRGARPGLGAAAFRSGDRLLLVLANLRPEPRPVRVQGPLHATAAALIATFPGGQSTPGVAGLDRLAFTVPGDTVMTVSIH
jgi:hypothetical protein